MSNTCCGLRRKNSFWHSCYGLSVFCEFYFLCFYKWCQLSMISSLGHCLLSFRGTPDELRSKCANPLHKAKSRSLKPFGYVGSMENKRNTVLYRVLTCQVYGTSFEQLVLSPGISKVNRLFAGTSFSKECILEQFEVLASFGVFKFILFGISSSFTGFSYRSPIETGDNSRFLPPRAHPELGAS